MMRYYQYRVNMFTDDGHLMGFWNTNSLEQAKGIRRNIKKGYAEIETL